MLKYAKKKKITCPECGSEKIQRLGAIGGSTYLFSCQNPETKCSHFPIGFSKSKMKNVSCYCNHGHRHDSRVEAGDCDKLHLMKLDPKQGILKIHKEKVWKLAVNNIKICDHKPDFTLELKGNKLKVVEVKGFATATWNLKRKLFKAIYPEVEYEIWWKK